MRSGEFQLIEKIRRMAGKARPPVALGIGDDCAVIDVRPGEVSLHTTDCLVEGVHFDREYFSERNIGWKAVAVNLSDIAAMGGRPVAFLLTLILPRSEILNSKSKILNSPGVVRGALACGRKYGCQLAGGNVSSTTGEALIVDVSMIGAARRGGVLERAGAKPGDFIFVAGNPGHSAAGLAALRSGNPKSQIPNPKSLLASHLRPQPMLALGRSLAGHGLATACIDTSDGLVQDLGHVCEESGVGAEIDSAKIPISPLLRRFCAATGRDPLDLALGGGEDYGLVFTVRENDIPKIARLKKFFPISAIGRITRGRGVHIAGEKRIKTPGFDHFA